MKIPLSLAIIGMACATAISAWVVPGNDRNEDSQDARTQDRVRSVQRRAEQEAKPDSYIVFGILPPEISAVTYDAWQFQSNFAVMRTLDATPDRRKETREPRFRRKLGDVATVTFVSMRDDYFVPGLFKAGQKTVFWDDSVLEEWLAHGVDTYAPLVGGFRNIERGELEIDGRAVLYNEVSYFSDADRLEMRAIFATWASAKSENAFLLFAMTAPEFTPDVALRSVLKEIVYFSDDIELPPKGSGDPLKGLNVAAEGSKGDSKDGKTYIINWKP